ncbi:MAG: hypothetical protein KF828_06855 [Anaerolineales bacterium]|nr:hypothetical protein [Anaerolineales bacterium]
MSEPSVSLTKIDSFQFAGRKPQFLLAGFECYILRAGTKGAYQGLARNLKAEVAIETPRMVSRGAKEACTALLRRVVQELSDRLGAPPSYSVVQAPPVLHDPGSTNYRVIDSRHEMLAAWVRVVEKRKSLCLNCYSHECEHVASLNSNIVGEPWCHSCGSSSCAHAVAVAQHLSAIAQSI